VRAGLNLCKHRADATGTHLGSKNGVRRFFTAILTPCALGLSLVLGACAAEMSDGPGSDSDKRMSYEQPQDLPILEAPEIIVSLDGLTTHLFDRATGFSRVYAVGVGRKGRDGRSYTPTGHFLTGPGESWWYIAGRSSPDYFAGLPFLRITIPNSDGHYTYGFHGPVTPVLRVGYVSHGCMRMRADDIIELFWLVRDHPGAPVSIQQAVELDAEGQPVVADSEPKPWEEGDEIAFDPDLGPRPRGFIGDPCDKDGECGGYPGDEGFFCHPAGFCSQTCTSTCTDYFGRAETLCEAEPNRVLGQCVSRASDLNLQCATLPGTVLSEATRWDPFGAVGTDQTYAVCTPRPIPSDTGF